MNGIEKLTAREQDLLLAMLNGGIVTRLNSGRNRAGIQPLREIKRKLDLNPDKIKEDLKQEYKEEQKVRDRKPAEANKRKRGKISG